MDLGSSTPKKLQRALSDSAGRLRVWGLRVYQGRWIPYNQGNFHLGYRVWGAGFTGQAGFVRISGILLFGYENRVTERFLGFVRALLSECYFHLEGV